MTLKANSRLAGATFLLYIVIGLTSLYLSTQAIEGQEGTTQKLASMAGHESNMQVVILLNLLSALCALILAVTLYALTRDSDRDLAMMGMCCRLAEGIIIVAGVLVIFAMLSVGSDKAPAEGNALGNMLLKIESSTGILAATCFSLGSTFYTYLFLRAKTIPVWLAWLGIFASILLVAVLPLQLAGYIDEGTLTNMVWMPMLVFELVLAFWLIIKGVATPARKSVLPAA